jgi:hypothetical protein
MQDAKAATASSIYRNIVDSEKQQKLKITTSPEAMECKNYMQRQMRTGEETRGKKREETRAGRVKSEGMGI